MTAFRVRLGAPNLRRVTYVWGGEGVDAELNSELLLTIRVPDDGPDDGQFIEFGIVRSNPRREIRLGRLGIGESYTIPLNAICGVYASCVHPIYIDCYIHTQNTPNTPSVTGVIGV